MSATAAISPRQAVYHDVTRLSAQDLYLFNEGTHSRLYQKLGTHLMTRDGAEGTYFAVWAPAADYVSVVGDFNGWRPDSHALRPRESSGIWEGFIPGLGQGAVYKYHVASRYHGYSVEKADPFAFFSELPPRTASVVHGLDHSWDDGDWMAGRRKSNSVRAPLSIYEVHLGSWMRVPEESRGRSGWLCLFQPLKSPMTATRSAPGAQTAK